MRLLIDTHILLWAMSADKRLTKRAETIMRNADMVFVSAASIWEISIKSALDKLDVDVDKLIVQIERAGFHELPITAAHATAVRKLPDIHRDPFDRILIAQAITEPLRLLSVDDYVAQYTGLVLKI